MGHLLNFFVRVPDSKLSVVCNADNHQKVRINIDVSHLGDNVIKLFTVVSYAFS
jgi:hypothetical protein